MSSLSSFAYTSTHLSAEIAHQDTVPALTVLNNRLRRYLQDFREALIGDHLVALLPASPP